MKMKEIVAAVLAAAGVAVLAIEVSKSQYQTNSILTVWDVQNAMGESYPIHVEEIPEETTTEAADAVVVDLVDTQEEAITLETTPPVSDEEIRQEAEETLEAYQVDLPENVKAYCEEVGNQYGICPELLEAIAWRESRYRSNAVNGTCTGMMQVSTTWHGDRMAKLGVSSLFDTEGCIRVAADYIAELADGGETGVAVALMTYNGDSRANEEGYVSKYADDILTVSAALERVHGK